MFRIALKGEIMEAELRFVGREAQPLTKPTMKESIVANTYDTTVSTPDLKDIRYSAWKCVELFVESGAYWIRSLPSVPACYALYLDGSLKYVGQTIDLQKRMLGHGLDVAHYSSNIQTPWGLCKRLHLKYRPTRKYGDWAMVELRLIKRLQPEANCVGSVRKRAGVGGRRA